jgi:hypothetical protein
MCPGKVGKVLVHAALGAEKNPAATPLGGLLEEME